ncbi:MAG: FAD-dependent oxidoreductase [Alphaproteobacteria bacterium]
MIETDLAIIGSGAGGLAAALAARLAGLTVTVFEKSTLVGGTSTLSGGLIWAPCNHLQKGASGDSPEAAHEYLRSCFGESEDEALWRAHVRTIPRVIEALEAVSPLRFQLVRYPESFAGRPGSIPFGRHVEVKVVRVARAGRLAKRLRRPMRSSLVTLGEFYNLGFKFGPMRAALRHPFLIGSRIVLGQAGMGLGLVTGLVAACLDHGVEFRLGWRARELLREGGRVVGVVGEGETGAERIAARRGVVIASGGFDWNKDLQDRYLTAPIEAPVVPPAMEGDGQLMAEAAGAALGKMDLAWWLAVSLDVKKNLDDIQVGTAVYAERGLPHAIIVNRRGRRFTNEAAHNMAMALFERDGATGELLNQPAWAVFDRQYRSRYDVLLAIKPTEPDPPWLFKADTVEGLARQVGIDPAGLADTLARFNRHALEGNDPEFGRGSFAFDPHVGDSRTRHPNLGTVERAPFYALRIHLGGVGTKGGVRTNARAQALRADGAPIPGLYAAGNAAATWFGAPMASGGITLSQALVMGWLAGRDAAGSNDEGA